MIENCQLSVLHEIDKRTKLPNARNSNRNSLLLSPLPNCKHSDQNAPETAESISFPDNPYLSDPKFFRLQSQRLDKPEEKFQFKCFDIGAQGNKSDSFMGSFLHVQDELKNPFDINIRIPSLREHVAFSNIGSLTKSQFIDNLSPPKNPQPQPQQQPSSLLHSHLLSSLQSSQSRRQTLQQQPSLSNSLFLDLQPILNYHPPQRTTTLMWQSDLRLPPSPSSISNPNSSKLIYPQIECLQVSRYEKNNHFFFEPERPVMTETELIRELCKVLQGVETEGFRIQYEAMRWEVVPGWRVRMQEYFGGSVLEYVKGVLQAATCRSQIEVALEYLRAKEPPSKFIYSQISAVLRQCLLCLQSIIISCLCSPTLTFLQFSLRTQHLLSQLHLLHHLLLTHPLPIPFPQKPLLHSQKQLFFMAYSRMKLNDYSLSPQHQLLQRLTFGSFKCILYSLNVRLHHSRKEWQQMFYQQYYFGLFFEHKREVIDRLSERLGVIQAEDYEVYSICREKREIRLGTHYAWLVRYEREWVGLWRGKREGIRGVEERWVEGRRRAREEGYERRAREIAEMKGRLQRRLENQMKEKSQNQRKQREYIKRLQEEIERKQQEQRLTRLIEIERQKGFLLDNQLNQKRQLLNHKHSLLTSHPQFASHFKQAEQSETLSLQRMQSAQSNMEEESVQSPIVVESVSEVVPMEKEVSEQREKKEEEEEEEKEKVVQKVVRMEERLEERMEEDGQGVTMVEAEVPLKTVLQVCVNKVIQGQLSVVNCAMASLIFTKYRISQVFQFLRMYFLSAKGHLISQLLQQSVDNHSNLKLSHLRDWLQPQDPILFLKPTFYLSDKSLELSGEVNLLEQSLQMKVGFEFRGLPDILKPYFGYLHLVKYMEILAFMLKLRQCVRLVDSQWKALNQTERQFRGRLYEGTMVKRLHFLRYVVQACLIRLQNYLFFHVIQEEYSKLQAHINARQFESLPDKHLHFLDRVILRGFISNPQLNISNRLKSLLASVRHLHQIVLLFCLDDIATYMRSDIDRKLSDIQSRFTEFSSILEHIMGDK